MEKVKLIALDLDGTLLMEDHSTVSKENIDALQRAAEKGIEIVISSGRTYRVLKDILEQVPSVSYAVIANGASAVNVEKREFMFYDGIPFDVWRPIYDELIFENAAFEVYFKGNSYIESERMSGFVSHVAPEEFSLELRQYITPVEDLPKFLDGQMIEKIHVLSVPNGRYNEVYKRFSQREDLMITNSMPGNFEINLATTNKATGLEALCSVLGIAKENVMAIGDADNDLEMLKWAGVPVAMENALPQVKEIAKYITLSNKNHGVAAAVKKYIFGEE